MSRRKTILQTLEQRFGDIGVCADLENPFLSQIAGRGSCRHYQNRSIDVSLLNTLCAVALSAPSKSDLQQRDIVILQDRVQRQKITDLFTPAEWFATAPSLLVVCGNNRRQRQIAETSGKPFPNDHLDAFFNATVDAGIVLSNLVNAAEAVGLGCCPISILRNYAEQISDILKLPDYVFPVAGLALGWPLNETEISPRLSLSTTVHVDQFDDHDVIAQINDYDQRRESQQPYSKQRSTEQFGQSERYGWSEDKARQYATPQRTKFGQFIKDKKFILE